MATKPLGLKILYSNDDPNRRIGCLINEIPKFKGNVLIDDILECVFKKFTDDGEPVLAIFPYGLHQYFTS